jgi:hypothetical protein
VVVKIPTELITRNSSNTDLGLKTYQIKKQA